VDIDWFVSGGQGGAVIGDDSWEAGPDWGEDSTTAQVVSELDDACAAVNRAQQQLFDALLRCDLRRVWIDDDCRDIAHWVALRVGISTWKARRWVACAWALQRYPLFRDAFADGRLSVDKLVELTRLADAVDESEEDLLKSALKESPAALRDRADWARKLADDDVQEATRQRAVKWWWDEERTFLNLHGSLPADMGVRVTNALDRLAAKLPVSPEDWGADGNGEVDHELTIEARRADALDLLAGQTIAADADADRATVVVHVPVSALVAGDRNATIGRGDVVGPAVAARLACDCRLQSVLHGDDGAIVGIGHTSGLIPLWLRRQVERRDGFRCTFPNCGSRLGLDCHHVVRFPEGPTEPGNLVLLCRTHHRLVHEHGWHVTMAPDQTTRWFRPEWTPYVPRPPARAPVEAQRENEQAASIDPQDTREGPRRWGLSPNLRLRAARAC
jgi:hypothetical protein